jgi:hypothetical protein
MPNPCYMPIFMDHRSTEPRPVLPELGGKCDLAGSREPGGVNSIDGLPPKLDLIIAWMIPDNLGDSRSALAPPTGGRIRQGNEDQ